MTYIDVMTSPSNRNSALDPLVSEKTKQKRKGLREKQPTVSKTYEGFAYNEELKRQGHFNLDKGAVCVWGGEMTLYKFI